MPTVKTWSELLSQQSVDQVLSPPEHNRGVPLDKSEGAVKGKDILGSAGAPLALPERVEDQDSGTSRCNHFSVEDRSTNHRFGYDFDHDSSMRTSRLVRDARAPNQRLGLACADQGHPRAALDANDLWIRFLGA
jgi:hypothetical protein